MKSEFSVAFVISFGVIALALLSDNQRHVEAKPDAHVWNTYSTRGRTTWWSAKRRGSHGWYTPSRRYRVAKRHPVYAGSHWYTSKRRHQVAKRPYVSKYARRRGLHRWSVRKNNLRRKYRLRKRPLKPIRRKKLYGWRRPKYAKRRRHYLTKKRTSWGNSRQYWWRKPTSRRKLVKAGCYGRQQYDKCGLLCDCVYHRLRNCRRIRKEFTSMTTSERIRYIKTVITVSTKSPHKEKYDRLIDAHRRLFSTGIHEFYEFLPWHRWFILEYENLLRTVDCRVTVPYWDWSIRSSDPWSASHVWHPSSKGFGGNGRSCVTTGPFRSPGWTIVGGTDCLRRNFNGLTPNVRQVKEALAINSFQEFEMVLRINLHDTVHCRIGGTMCSLESATAPEFFLHHGYVDKIWADWQKRGPTFKNAYFPSNRSLLTGTLNGNRYYTTDFIDLNKQPGNVRVEYGKLRPTDIGTGGAVVPSIGNGRGGRINHHKISRTKVSVRKGSSVSKRPTLISNKAIRLFKVSPEEAKKAKEYATKHG